MKTFLLVLALCVSAAAQSLTATTPDGRQVLLNPDGTWKFTAADPSAALSIEAALIYQSGDVKPVARTTFYLLDKSAAEVLRDAGLRSPVSLAAITKDAGLECLIAFAKSSLSAPNHEAFFSAAQKAIQPHIVKTATTDLTGKAAIQGLPAKPVYLLGVARTARGWAVWDLRIDLKAGANSAAIDQSNTAFLY